MNLRLGRYNQLDGLTRQSFVPGRGIEPLSHVFQTRAVTNLAILAGLVYFTVVAEGLEPPTSSM